ASGERRTVTAVVSRTVINQNTSGKYWYTCRQGDLKPEGCFSPTNERLPIGGTFVENGYEIQCILDNSGYLQFKFSACVPKPNKRYLIGETWEDDQVSFYLLPPTYHMYWFECKADGPYLRVEIRGCVTHDKTRRIALDEVYDFGEYTYVLIKFSG
ncbi:unnamed protein product, partial [Gongylonema pulchrum]|uniref:ZP domain-containing protein n=1 Tax=Gongylonema pulchrum TaxID=637853 RepID=A0A183EC68_9BILA